jgi:2-polyprenyl-3-methyl-5-hydroxy-6-metoxy-1,4-benzoquinol methylase
MKYSVSYALIRRITGRAKRKLMPKAVEISAISNFFYNMDNCRILDYGCDSGFLLDIIRKNHPAKHFELFGTDINEYALQYARQTYPDFTFYDLDQGLYNNGKFDIIILSHVLEHVHDRNQVVKNLKRLLRTDGTLIIAIPQERVRGDCTLIELLYNMIRGRFENPHVVKISYQNLNELLTRNGLYIKEHKYTNFFYPFYSDKRRIDSTVLVALCGIKSP